MSGDLGRFDAKGCLEIVGRKKDLIIRGGHNIHPAKIEDLAMRHPAVARVAAFPVPDERLGEKVCLSVIFHEGAGAEPDELLAHLHHCRVVALRHARVFHRDGRVSADRERQDPEARACRMGAQPDESVRCRCAGPKQAASEGIAAGGGLSRWRSI